MLSQIHTGGYTLPTKETYGAYAERWLTDHASLRAPSTKHRYIEVVRSHFIPFFGEMRLGKITTQDVQRYVSAESARGAHPNTLRMEATILHSRSLRRSS